MLRAWFIVGALIFLGAWVVAMALMALGRWAGLDLAAYASTLVLVVLVVWVAMMIGGTAYRVARFFAKPS